MLVEARHILNKAAVELADAGIDSARSDARLMLGLAIGRDEPVLPHEEIDELSSAQYASFTALIERRLNGEPVSRMRGWREFWSLRFAISPATLDPRPDSEVLVEAACRFAKTLPGKNNKDTTGTKDTGLNIVDLGTGSGCLLLACLMELPAAEGIGIDINPAALKTAQQNAVSLGVDTRARFVERSFTKMPGDELMDCNSFDIVLCNPPYIPTTQIDDLAPDVAVFDPRLALDGGVDGFDCWRDIMPVIVGLLTPHGRAFVEIGDGQADGLDAIAVAAGLRPIEQVPDLSGTIRTLIYGHIA